MKSAETEILIVAGYEGSGPDHWQSRILNKLSSAKLVEQPDWLYGRLDVAVALIVDAVEQSTKPVVFIAHSAGCSLVAHAVAVLNDTSKLRGAYFVSAPSSQSLAGLPKVDLKLSQFPRKKLPFASLLVASSNDPFASLEEQRAIAVDWGATLVEAGEVGHINAESGHGPWPEGIMRFAAFLAKL